MGKDTPRKEKGPKKYTRMQAERALSRGEDPEKFKDHPNYHVRAKAWRKMGMPLPEKAEDRTKFLESIHVKEKQPEPQAEVQAQNEAH